MAGKKNKTLAVEIDSTAFKWAVFKGHGSGAEILDIGAFPLSDSGDVISRKIEDIQRRHKIEPQDVAGCLPRSQVTARNLELPSTDLTEIKQMFELQAAKQTPYAADQIISDYYLIDSSHANYSNIMLVVAHRQAISEHVRILQEAGLKPQKVFLSTAESVAWISHALSATGRKPEKETAVVIDVDSEDTDFFVYGQDKLLFTQSISIGSEKLFKEFDQWREKFLSEVTRALEIFRGSEITGDVSLFFITGAFQALKPLVIPLQTIVGHMPLELEVPAETRRILEADPADQEWLRKQSFTSVLGLVYQNKEPLIDLVPQEVLIQSALVEKGKGVLVMGILVLLIALSGIGFFGWKYYLRQTYLEWLDKQISSTETDAQQVESTRALIKQIVHLNHATAGFFQDMIHVCTTLPREIYLTELNINREGLLDMRGRSDRITSVFDFVNQLKSRPSFQAVETRQLTKRMVENKEVVDFEIHCQLSEN